MTPLHHPVSRRLEGLHATLPSSSAIVFGDLSTGTVLRAVGDSALRQETHDAALELAMECFCEDSEGALTAASGASTRAVPMRALRWERARLHLLRRGGDDGMDALVVSLDPQLLNTSSDADASPAAALQRIDAACMLILDGHD